MWQNIRHNYARTLQSLLRHQHHGILINTAPSTQLPRLNVSPSTANVRNLHISFHSTSPKYAAPVKNEILNRPRISEHVEEHVIFESQLGLVLLPRFAWAATALFGIGVAMVGLLALREDVETVRQRNRDQAVSHESTDNAKSHSSPSIDELVTRRRLAGLDTTITQRLMLGVIPVGVVGVLLLIVKRGGSRLVSRISLLPRNRVRIECSHPWSSRSAAKNLSQVHSLDAIIPGASVSADASQLFQPWQVLVNPNDPNSTLKTYFVPAGGNVRERLDTGKLALMAGISFGNTARPDARATTIAINDIDTQDVNNPVAYRRPAHKD